MISLNNLVNIVNLNNHLGQVENIGKFDCCWLRWLVVKEEEIWRQKCTKQQISSSKNVTFYDDGHLFYLISSESPTKYSTTPHMTFIIRSFRTFLSILMLQIILIMTEYLALHSCSVVLRLGRKPCLAKSPPPLCSIPNSAANQYLQYYHCCYCYCPALTKLNSLRASTGSKMSQNGNFRN